MSSVDQVRQQLVDCELMTAETAGNHIARWREQTGAGESAAGEELLAWLVDQQVLTEFQSGALHAGHAAPLMIGLYRVFDRAAIGRLGNIYRAVHDALGQAVSLKVFPSSLKDEPESLARMQREIQVSAELDHPNVVRMYHMGQVGEIHYLAFEDLRGEPLHERLDREGALHFATACALMRDAAQGLAHFHDKFLVHRDVRPANLWVTESGTLKVMESGAVRIALTGLTETEDGTVTTSDTVLGTYDYMAPEQAKSAHAADHRSDIYALGCTTYHCLTGHPPFVERNPVRLVMRHASETPAPVTELVADIPEELADAVGSMLAKSPDERYQSMEDVVHVLEQYADPTAPDAVLEASEDFLSWLRETPSHELPESDSPQATAFLAWLAEGRPSSE